MEINFSGPQVVPVGGVIVFPDAVFVDQPRDAPLTEQVFIRGTTAGTSVSFGGEVELPNN